MHDQIAQKLIQSGNCICVLAAGLGEQLVSSSIVSIFSKKFQIKPLIVQIDSEDGNSDKREYSAGGLVRVSARVALADLLSRRLDPKIINMILIEKCGSLTENSNTIFCIQIFREFNLNAHLICLTDNVGSARNLQNLLSWMHVSEILLYPRFHEIVQKYLKISDLNVIQEEIDISETELEIQKCLCLIVKSIFMESGIDMDVEEFFKNGMSFSNNDLYVIRKLSILLLRSDSITFHKYLMEEKKMTPMWFSDLAHKLMLLSEKNLNQIPNKWTLIMREIAEFRGSSLVACYNQNSAEMIKLLLSEGPERALLERKKCMPGDIQNQIDSLPHFESVSASVCLFSELPLHLPEADRVIIMEPNLSAVRAIEICKKKFEKIVILTTPTGQSQKSFSDLVSIEMRLFDELIRTSFIFKSRGEPVKRFEKKRTRKGGLVVENSIIIDTRELRSALPFVLYRQNFRIVLATIQVGDYVLSRDICVERKSVTGNDLQQSLYSGRLYKQLVNMVYEYSWPVLLLEFHNDSIFQLYSSPTGEIDPKSLIAQVISLCIHFPSLRIVWSPKFEFSSKIFSTLKTGRDQPKLATPKESQSRWIEFLKSCPGIGPNNLGRITGRVKNVCELVSMDEESILNLLGKRDGHIFLNFINQPYLMN